MIVKQKIKSFTDLNAWQEAHKFVISVYKSTRLFPSEERFGLVNQLQRASVSITSNIAEGFSRNSAKEKIQFYRMSMGSLTEVQNQLLLARDLEYISKEMFMDLANGSVVVSKLIMGIIKSAKRMDLK